MAQGEGKGRMKREEITPLKPTPEDKWLIEIRRLQTEELARIFGVPAHLIAGPSYGAIAEEADISFLKGVLTKMRVLTIRRKRSVKGGTR
jgi:phage portal protein BeeE